MKMKRGLILGISIVGAMAALALVLTGVAAMESYPVDDSRPALPPARPHSPNTGVYTLYDTLTLSDVPTATYQWIEIRDSADYEWDLQGPFDEWDVSPSFPIGFYFAFYNDFYTHFRVSENGYIFFEKPGVDVGSGHGMPGVIPDGSLAPGTDAANNFIGPFAADLLGYPGVSRVYVRNDSNPRRTIIEFENMVWCCGPYNPRTFQVIVYPNGAIEMQYRKITDFAGTLDEDMHQIVRVGLENLDGTGGDVYVQQDPFAPDDSNFWDDEMAVRFERGIGDAHAIFLPDSRRIWDDPGRSITTTSDLYLGASDTVTRSFNLTYTLVVSSYVPLATWANGITYPLSAVVTGTYSTTLQFIVSVPSAVTDFNDMATVVFTAVSTDAVPMITATHTITYGPAHRDLQIEKTLDPDINPAAGGALRYHLMITNTDANDSDRAAIAHGVLVTDLLPAGVTYEDCRRTYNWRSCGLGVVETNTIGSRTVVTVNLGTMDIEEVERLWLEVRNYNSSVGTDIGNTAHVTTTQDIELGDGPNNHSSVAFTVAITDSQLYINKYYPYPHNNHNYVAAGQAIRYNIQFYNSGRYDGDSGNAPLYDVVISDTLPEGTTFHTATLSYGGPDLLGVEGPIAPTISGPLSRTLVFTIPVVDNGSWNDAHLQLWVNIPQTMPIGTFLTNTVTISDGVSSAADDEVVEIAWNYVDPFVDKEPSRDTLGNVIPPEPDKDYTYWIHYGNRSVLTDATNVFITDTLPLSVTLVSASSGRYLTGPVTSTLPGGAVQITWYTDTLPAGRMGEVMIMVHVGDDVPPGTELANQVVITYTGEFTPSTTLDDTDILTVEVASDFHNSRKLVDDETPNAGDTIEYTIVVNNANLANTASFTVTDPLPPELTYAGHDPPSTGSVAAGPNHILWTGGTVGPNSETTLTFRATITGGAQIDDVIWNTAYITAGGTSIQRSVAVTVAGSVFDSSSKDPSASQVASGSSFTYTITVRNSGSAASGVVTVTDSLPPALTLVSGSFNPTAGTVTPSGDSRAFTWTIPSVAATGSESLSFQVTVTEGIAVGATIDNVAYLDDGISPAPISIMASVTITSPPGGGIYLPIVVKNQP